MAREDGFFDDVARGLADGSVTRGKALRLMGAALVGGALGSVGLGAEASADPPGCKRNGKFCTRPEQCCSRNCSGGSCQAQTTTTTTTTSTTSTTTSTTSTTPACIPDFTDCAADEQCCSGICDVPIRRGYGYCSICRSAGGSCGPDVPCCTAGTCVNGICCALGTEPCTLTTPCCDPNYFCGDFDPAFGERRCVR